jgi:2-oxoglutarate ferredoxin oxidoreductase subunit delta
MFQPQRNSIRDGDSGGVIAAFATNSLAPTPRNKSMAKGSVQIVVERCKACGFCVEFCPTHVLALSSAFNAKGYHPPYMVNPEKCSGCDLCGMYCPDFAIFGFKNPLLNDKDTKNDTPAAAPSPNAQEEHNAR